MLSPSISRVIKKHFPVLQSSPKLEELFQPNSIISSFRRPKNLKEILAPSKGRKSSLPNTDFWHQFQVLSNVEKLDVIFVRKSLWTPTCFLASKLAKPTSYNSRCHEKSCIKCNLQNVRCVLLLNSKLDSGTTNHPWKPTRKLAKLPYT